MKELTAQAIKQFALNMGADLVGVANIERFQGAPRRMHPAEIFPECRSVIVLIRRILRGNWRGIEEGTYWPNYTYFGYHGLLNSFFIPHVVYETSCFIEDHGWEAVPYYPGVPERQPPEDPVRPGAVGPDVHMAIRIAGIAAGLGECGWSKVFLTKKFGPRVRLHAILTDAPLAADALVEPGSLCDKCGSCVRGCPGAIPPVKDGPEVSVRIEDKTYTWGDVHMGRCTLCFHGGDPRVSPFIHKSFPGYEFDVTKQDVSENVAYKFCWPMSLGDWRATDEDPSGHIIEGHRCLRDWGGDASYAVEGSRGCMRSCFDHLEKRNAIEQTFENGPFIKRPRWMLDCRVPSADDVAKE
jgi:epoxyqueuosine reductase